MAAKTSLGKVFERKYGITDWEEMVGGEGTRGKMCQVCSQLQECEKKGDACGGKTIILLMAVMAIKGGEMFMPVVAALLRKAVESLAKGKEEIRVHAVAGGNKGASSSD